MAVDFEESETLEELRNVGDVCAFHDFGNGSGLFAGEGFENGDENGVGDFYV